MDYDRFKESFKNIKTNFLEYISNASAILKKYLQSNSYFKEKSKITETITVQQTVTQPKLNRLVYNKILTNSISVPNNSPAKWAIDKAGRVYSDNHNLHPRDVTQ